MIEDSSSQLIINSDISEAETLPSSFYTNENFYTKSLEKIFEKSWQLITDLHCFDSQNIQPFTFLKDSINEPLLLTKSNEKVRCLSNVCTHRAHLVCTNESDSTILRCRYHGRTFELNGNFKAMPGFEGVKNFPTSKDNLENIESFVWKDFIFVSLNPEIDITLVFADIEHRLQGYEVDKLVFDKKQSKEYIIDSNWALYCENYLEEFHLPFVHKGLTNDIILDEYKTICLENAVLQTAICKDGENAISLRDSAPDYAQNMYAYYYWIFPNLMLNFYAWGLSINIIEPLSINKTRIKYLTYSFSHKKQPSTNGADVGTVEIEDQSVIQSVQQGINSRYYESGRYSVKYEKGIHHFHRMIAKYLRE